MKHRVKLEGSGEVFSCGEDQHLLQGIHFCTVTGPIASKQTVLSGLIVGIGLEYQVCHFIPKCRHSRTGLAGFRTCR